ncbi:MAG TPA: FliM/FliN family flagellar motor switch protein [Bryobacteraceae bacterium]|jgi:flagellar motor switch protein FliN/FliY|nr:FliM/FliN family flagellar motor switch protein [Bryobacteraceae bacterium]
MDSPVEDAIVTIEDKGVTGSNDAPMLRRLLDLELPLAVLLGRAVMPIQEVLKLTSGSLIELDRSVSDLVDLLVHGTVVARGEIVSLRGNYAVRIKEIISREDRFSLRANA